MIPQARTALLPFGLAVLFSVTPGFSQTQTVEPPRSSAQPLTDSQKSAAYYNFAMGHLYAELAGALPADTTMVTPAERAAAMWDRFRGIRRRYVL